MNRVQAKSDNILEEECAGPVVVLPAFNEEKTLAATVRAFVTGLPEARIVIVDNNSSDATPTIASDLVNELPGRVTLLHEPRQGKANAVRNALNHVDADIYVLADADLTYMPDDAREMIDWVRNGICDMAVGDRGIDGGYRRENKRKAHVFGNRLVVGLINLLFNACLSDVMSGYRVFNRRFAELYPVLVDGFELEVDMTVFALMAKFTIKEKPISYRDRPDGSESKLHTLRDGWRVMHNIVNIFRHYNPLHFFGALGGGIFALGIICGAVPVDEFLRTHYVSRVPLALLAVGLVMTALICVSTGLVLSTVSRWGRMELEQKIRRYGRGHGGCS